MDRRGSHSPLRVAAYSPGRCITAGLAARVAPGRVTALETSGAVLQHTWDEVTRRGCSTVDFVVGDVLALKAAQLDRQVLPFQINVDVGYGGG